MQSYADVWSTGKQVSWRDPSCTLHVISGSDVCLIMPSFLRIPVVKIHSCVTPDRIIIKCRRTTQLNWATLNEYRRSKINNNRTWARTKNKTSVLTYNCPTPFQLEFVEGSQVRWNKLDYKLKLVNRPSCYAYITSKRQLRIAQIPAVIFRVLHNRANVPHKQSYKLHCSSAKKHKILLCSCAKPVGRPHGGQIG